MLSTLSERQLIMMMKEILSNYAYEMKDKKNQLMQNSEFAILLFI
jgi:hypothetical protein